MSVRVLDAEVRRTFSKVKLRLEGKRRWPVMERYIKWKRKRLMMPWKSKGISETGRKGTWKPNAINTAQKKLRKRGISKPRKEITMQDRYKYLMNDTGDLRDGVKVRFSKPKKKGDRQCIISVKGRAKQYAYYQLHGNPRNDAPARPWGVWMDEEVRYLAKELEKDVAKTF